MCDQTRSHCESISEQPFHLDLLSASHRHCFPLYVVIKAHVGLLHDILKVFTLKTIITLSSHCAENRTVKKTQTAKVEAVEFSLFEYLQNNMLKGFMSE